jgi:hypothetical protein
MATAGSVSDVLGSFEVAEAAYQRVAPEIEALRQEELVTLNVDVVSATSIVLGAADRILTFRDQFAKMPDFDLRCIDKLKDYAIAAWYVHITNLPVPEPAEAEALLRETVELRAKFLRWSAPLSEEGILDRVAVDKIKEGSGNKDAPSDVVAFVGLYRANWQAIKGNCGVTEADLERGALIGPKVFSLVSQREHRSSTPRAEASLRVRRAWTLPDRAYTQCRRALQYLRFEEGDADDIAPNVRANSGMRSSTAVASGAATPSSSPEVTAPGVKPAGTTQPIATPLVQPVFAASSPPVGDVIGGKSSPFTTG